MDENKKKLDEVYTYESKLRNNIWNEAIEAAAKCYLEYGTINNKTIGDIVSEIRKLKK